MHALKSQQRGCWQQPAALASAKPGRLTHQPRQLRCACSCQRGGHLLHQVMVVPRPHLRTQAAQGWGHGCHNGPGILQAATHDFDV